MRVDGCAWCLRESVPSSVSRQLPALLHHVPSSRSKPKPVLSFSLSLFSLLSLSLYSSRLLTLSFQLKPPYSPFRVIFSIPTSSNTLSPLPIQKLTSTEARSSIRITAKQPEVQQPKHPCGTASSVTPESLLTNGIDAKRSATLETALGTLRPTTSTQFCQFSIHEVTAACWLGSRDSLEWGDRRIVMATVSI